MFTFAEEKGLEELLGLVSLAAWMGNLQMEHRVYLPYGLPGTYAASFPICPTVQETSCCWATPASPLHSDLSHMGNFKTLTVPFCSSRASCFSLDP